MLISARHGSIPFNVLTHLILTPKRKVLLSSPFSDEELRQEEVSALPKVIEG